METQELKQFTMDVLRIFQSNEDLMQDIKNVFRKHPELYGTTKDGKSRLSNVKFDMCFINSLNEPLENIEPFFECSVGNMQTQFIDISQHEHDGDTTFLYSLFEEDQATENNSKNINNSELKNPDSWNLD